MKFDLHPHQTAALDMLRASLASGKRRPMLQAPTGFGKTLLSAAIVEGALRKSKRVLFTVPAISLIDQTVEKFEEQGIDAIGVMQGYHPRTDGSQPVQVASIQTLMNRRLPQVDIVVIDEAHRWFTKIGEWMASAEWAKIPIVGLSATPWTKGLGKHYDDLIVAARMVDLIRDGFLSRYEVYAPSHPDLSKVKTVAGDYHEGQLAEVMNQPTLVADVVSTWLRQGGNRPTLCFAVDRAHARKLADDFEAAGVPTGYIDMDTEPNERAKIGRRLAEGQIKVVCNVGTLTTGIDWDVRCIILARPTKSEMLFVQIIGRGLRLADGKTDCLVLDHSDTTIRLGFPTDIHHPALDTGKHQESSKTKRERPTPLPKECPKCTFLKPAGIRKCQGCGFEPERQSAIEEHAGTLVQLKGGKKTKGEATSHSRQEVWSMLLWLQREKQYKPGFAKAKFLDRYGGWPNGLFDQLLPPDAEFNNWMLGERIRYAKKKQKLSKSASDAA